MAFLLLESRKIEAFQASMATPFSFKKFLIFSSPLKPKIGSKGWAITGNPPSFII